MQLGLQFPYKDEKGQSFSRPLPQFLTSTPEKSALVGRVMEALADPQSGSQLSVFKNANDEFHFLSFQESLELLESVRANLILGREGIRQHGSLSMLPRWKCPTPEAYPTLRSENFL
jgi:hypothetical protein